MASDLPTARDILDTHDEVVDHWDLKYPGTRVAAPRLKFKRLLEDIPEANTDHEAYHSAALLLRNITTSHFFEDGNKRTAWLTMRTYLDRKDLEPAERGERAERVMRRIRRFSPSELADWLETGDIDEDRLTP
ncbi:hypothetical protein MBEHAL_1090 [Halarchaeum acidiphilum MH1-52-1]|uniref:Fido domain-containing protein n=1 Tax=Halarchaeum acidiphilum MH1-52-1 TaxID=1261545 RepID=U2YTL2_9EURY|nr:Fic family protein [Halarchaeum acidiphilum]GAD52330.1 hypothetical protein MBEHAL_1090 [Halarchaeum acidiphilum MH1-52-1]